MYIFILQDSSQLYRAAYLGGEVGDESGEFSVDEYVAVYTNGTQSSRQFIVPENSKQLDNIFEFVVSGS